MDVPGVGDQAFIEVTAGNALILQFLKGDTWVTLQLRLQPSAMIEDLPYLTDLARAVAARIPRETGLHPLARRLLPVGDMEVVHGFGHQAVSSGWTGARARR